MAGFKQGSIELRKKTVVDPSTGELMTVFRNQDDKIVLKTQIGQEIVATESFVQSISSDLQFQIDNIGGDLFIVESSIDGITGGLAQLDTSFVNVTGDTMTGNLTVNAELDVSGHTHLASNGMGTVASPNFRFGNDSTFATGFYEVIGASTKEVGLSIAGTKVFDTRYNSIAVSDKWTFGLAVGARINEFSTDGTMGGNSAVAVPTESAVVTYVGNKTYWDKTGTQITQKTANDTLLLTTSEQVKEILTIKNTNASSQSITTIGWHDEDGLAFDMYYFKNDTNTGWFELYENRNNFGALRVYMGTGNMEVRGGLTLNTGAGDRNITFNKELSGSSYQYLASNDTHTFYSPVIVSNTNLTVDGNLTVTGNIIQISGSNITQIAETLIVEDNLIVLNSGETGSEVSLGESGIQIDRGSGAPYQFMFMEDLGTAQEVFAVGMSGQLHPVATREETPISNGLAYWDSGENRFKTNVYALSTISSISGQVLSNDNDISGLSTDVDSISGQVLTIQTYTSGISGGLTQLNDLYVNVSGDEMTGDLYISSPTPSTSTSTGALKVVGGISSLDNGYFGGRININSTSAGAASRLNVNSHAFVDPDAVVQISSGADDKNALVVMGNSATQTNSIFEVSRSTGAHVFSVGANGNIAISPIALTGVVPTTSFVLNSANHTNISTGQEFSVFAINAGTHQFAGTTTKAVQRFAIINAPTYTSASATTTTTAATLSIEGAPIASGSMTITNPYALWVRSGRSRFSGSIDIADVAYTWPSSQGVSNSSIHNDGSGNLSWTPVIEQVVAVPADQSSIGIAGQVAYDANYKYECKATDTWIRFAVESVFTT